MARQLVMSTSLTLLTSDHLRILQPAQSLVSMVLQHLAALIVSILTTVNCTCHCFATWRWQKPLTLSLLIVLPTTLQLAQLIALKCLDHGHSTSRSDCVLVSTRQCVRQTLANCSLHRAKDSPDQLTHVPLKALHQLPYKQFVWPLVFRPLLSDLQRSISQRARFDSSLVVIPC